MNKYILILLSIYPFHVFIAQQRSISQIFYDKGNIAFAKKDYKTADSLFSLSLNLEPHPDSYYNRAVCRRQLNDIKGYCLDLLNAADLFDLEAKNLFWKQCAIADTIYKKNNGDAATKLDYELVEYIKSYKFNTDFDYQKSDTTKKIILSKIRDNNEVIYRDCRDVMEPRYTKGIANLVVYLKTQTEFLKLIKDNKLAGLATISLVIDENGKPKKIEIKDGVKNKASDELVRALFNTPNWTPAFYDGRAVKFQAQLFVTYYDSVVDVSFNLFSLRANDGKEPIVEIMPEFIGGPMAMLKFIQKEIVYPRSAKEAGLQGKCFLKFVVLPNGKLANLQIIKGVPGCTECDREAIRVIQLMPQWEPAKKNGKQVSCFFNLPINFQLR